MRSALKLVAYLSILLTLWSGYTFATHNHFSSVDEAKCTVCVGAHSATPVSAPKLPSADFIRISVVVAKRISAKQRLIAFALTVRPPPAA
jgi:hypothetical protein